MKFNSTLAELIELNLQQKIVPALMGEPGIGKSSFVEALAYSMSTRAFVLPVNQLAEKADLTGARLVPTEDGKSMKQVFFPHHVISECIDYALANPRETPILFLDEINRTTSDVTSGALTLVTLRRMGHVALPDNVRIIVAGNDKGNVVSLDEASISRFAIYHIEPDAATFIALMGDSLNPWVKKVLTQFPAMIFGKSVPSVLAVDGQDDDDDKTAMVADLFDGGEEMLQLTTPRTIENVSRLLNTLSPTQLTTYLATTTAVGDREISVLGEIIEAHVGNTVFATQLVSEIAEDLASGTVSTSATVNVPRPNAITQLRNAATQDELEKAITSLTDHERSACLLYAMKDASIDAKIIAPLALATTRFEADHIQTLVELMRHQQSATANVQAFLDSGTPIAASLSPVLSAFQ